MLPDPNRGMGAIPDESKEPIRGNTAYFVFLTRQEDTRHSST